MKNYEIANTEYGPVQGVHKISALGSEYISFQGIPYMKATVGKLRFRDAQDPHEWSDPYDTTEDAPCYCTSNLITRVIEGQENAGTINVFTKCLRPEKPFPVMIWIHGGGFNTGNSKTDIYGPDFLLTRDVIFVSFNYRLGVFGFLSLDDEALRVPGNAGLKDQLFALKWVKRNIKYFGGDPKNVTVFGESAGAHSIHYLCMAEQAKGLFQRAIIMSGSAFCKPWSLVPRKKLKKYTELLARDLGYKGKISDEENLLEFLENAPAIEIMEKSLNFPHEDDVFAYACMIAYGPVIEPYNSGNCIIDRDPVEMARNAWSNDIEIIFTSTSFEGIGSAFGREEVAYSYLNNSACFCPLMEFDLEVSNPFAKEYGERIKDLYFGENQKPAIETQESYLRYCSDLYTWHGIYRSILSRLTFANGRTYLLRFDVNGRLNFAKISVNCQHYNGAAHFDDIFYLFKTNLTDVPDKNSKESKTIERMVGIFTNFATTGDPNHPQEFPANFSPISDKNVINCIQITENEVKIIELPKKRRLDVWNSIYEDHEISLI